MSDIGVAEIPVTDDDELSLPPIAVPVRNALVDGPILRTLLWLAWPNVIALSAGTCVVIAHTSYIGRLGGESLAAEGAGVSVRDPAHDHVGRGDGRRRVVGDRPCARRRRQGTRQHFGGACAVDRRLFRTDLHGCYADLRAGAVGDARRPRRGAVARDRLYPD